MENLSTPPPSIGFYSRGNNIETGATIKISSGGLNGNLIANGTISLRVRLNIKDDLFADLSTILTDNVSSYSIATGKYFNINYYKLPENIRSSSIKGMSVKAITGLNFKYKHFTSCIFLSINRESLSSGIYFGFIK
jgi:hypothetical protein